jgi:hypothetical protein
MNLVDCVYGKSKATPAFADTSVILKLFKEK